MAVDAVDAVLCPQLIGECTCHYTLTNTNVSWVNAFYRVCLRSTRDCSDWTSTSSDDGEFKVFLGKYNGHILCLLTAKGDGDFCSRLEDCSSPVSGAELERSGSRTPSQSGSGSTTDSASSTKGASTLIIGDVSPSLSLSNGLTDALETTADRQCKLYMKKRR